MKRAIMTALIAAASVTVAMGQGIDEHLKDLPFPTPDIREPRFPDRSISIVEHGAVADGRTLNTAAFARAIQACAVSGGGKVVVPRGTWLSGSIKLESNINLHLERGALLQFSSRITDFPLIPGFDGKARRFVIAPPLYADHAQNIAITGSGVIDGAGEMWRYVKKEKQTERQWRELIASGGVVSADGAEWWPSKEAMQGERYIAALEKSGKEATAADYAQAREYLRPDMVRLSRCNGVLIDGPTFRNSPRFHVHPVQSENIIVRNVLIQTPWHAQNGDGLDLSACRNVLVYNVVVDVGDDALCLKPSRIGDHQKPGPACSNIVIEDCMVYHGHGGFVIGSESYGGVRNVSVRNCLFIGTDVGVRFKSARDRGGLVEDVTIDGIQMRSIENEAVLFDMFYGGGSPDVEAEKRIDAQKAEPVTSLTPRFQNITIKNVVCSGARRAVRINGLPEMPIQDILFENVSVSGQRGVQCVDADGINFRGCSIIPGMGPVLAVKRSRNVTVQGGSYPATAPVFLTVEGVQTANISLIGVDVSNAAKDVEYTDGAKPGTVVVR